MPIPLRVSENLSSLLTTLWIFLREGREADPNTEAVPSMAVSVCTSELLRPKDHAWAGEPHHVLPV